MLFFRDHLDLGAGGARAEVAFTDSSVDLRGGSERPGFPAALDRVVAEAGVPFARISQVHGTDVVDVVTEPSATADDEVPTADALVTSRARTGLMIRVADCVPVVLVDETTGMLGAAHAGRVGVRLGVVPRTVAHMRGLGAGSLRAWIGPHVCGRCYEVPEEMRDEVAGVVPETFTTTPRGTPALDLGAGVRAQLERDGVPARVVAGCTLEDPRLHSHRRDGARAGRLAALVWRP